MVTFTEETLMEDFIFCAVFFFISCGNINFFGHVQEISNYAKKYADSNQRESVESKYVGIAYGVPQGSFLRLLLLMFIKTFFQVTS